MGLAALEAGPSLIWFHQVRGLLTLAKLGMLGAMRFCLEYRLAVLLFVVVIASVGSHMPARFRYYSVVYRKVLRCRGGPGASWLTGEDEEDE
ncbi:MAG: hypothetical protein A2V70_01470 [Planctomycetes bacterium RBG_13_63_9]|nr:MAG: hypothetical protein A2V70_01470 [Planctomycetes bacterium RBG_13_63_9]